METSTVTDLRSEATNAAPNSYAPAYSGDTPEWGTVKATDKWVDATGRKCKRGCLVCGQQKTPQWREGPFGPQTLCNACGVGWRKKKELNVSTASGDTAQMSPSASAQRAAFESAGGAGGLRRGRSEISTGSGVSYNSSAWSQEEVTALRWGVTIRGERSWEAIAQDRRLHSRSATTCAEKWQLLKQRVAAAGGAEPKKRRFASSGVQPAAACALMLLAGAALPPLLPAASAAEGSGDGSADGSGDGGGGDGGGDGAGGDGGASGTTAGDNGGRSSDDGEVEPACKKRAVSARAVVLPMVAAGDSAIDWLRV